jgi:hypothetical protein
VELDDESGTLRIEDVTNGLEVAKGVQMGPGDGSEFRQAIASVARAANQQKLRITSVLTAEHATFVFLTADDRLRAI